MSNVNIKRAVDNIKSNITVYSPITEVIVNAIHAIETRGSVDGKIKVLVYRSPQIESDDSLSAIESIKIIDNGIGFTDENRNSFDTLYSDYKIDKGGKGFGRFICLKYFENFHVDSIYIDTDGKYKRRIFSMGKNNDIIVDEKITDIHKTTTGCTIHLDSIKDHSLNKKLSTVGRILVEKLLPYFFAKGYNCPEITLQESDGSDQIILNHYLNDPAKNLIKEIDVQDSTFILGKDNEQQSFEVRIFKIYYPKNQKSKISLVAHNREVIETSTHNYIPEFIDEFYDKIKHGDEDADRNFIIKTYVMSNYLDENVSLERVGFYFQNESNLYYSISQANIETKAAEITKQSLLDEFTTRFEKKQTIITNYVDTDAPWHKGIIKDIDFTNFPYNPSNEEIESLLQKEKFRLDVSLTQQVYKILNESNKDNVKENVSKIVGKISESNKNDLIHYIVLRRRILDLFKKSLELKNEEEYSSEGIVHDIIFTRKKDSESVFYDEHNLWIIDERLNFTDFISSDIPLDGGKTDRPDLLIFDKRVAFRGDNESSNPVTIFEFKKPDRDDFVNPSSKEDPVQQIIRYVNNIRAGNYKTPQGRKINVAPNTPFYGYVICDLSKKVENWLEFEKNFSAMPDRLGWFSWFSNINLYMEVLSWDKILKDADMRNKIFFHKLGI